MTDRRAASPYTNDNSKWVEVTGAVTRDAVNKVDGLSVLPVDDVETNEELALQIAMDPTIETSKEFDERRALQKAKLLSRLRNESDVDIADIPASANGFPAKMEGMRETDDRQDDVFIVELEKGDDGIGLGLIDGLVRVVILFVSAGQLCRVGRPHWIVSVIKLPTLDTAYLFSRAFSQLHILPPLQLHIFRRLRLITWSPALATRHMFLLDVVIGLWRYFRPQRLALQ